MAKEGMVNKSVTFNSNDPDEADLLKHAKSRSNFSRYVKMLIWKDMHNITGTPTKDSADRLPDFVTKELLGEFS